MMKKVTLSLLLIFLVFLSFPVRASDGFIKPDSRFYFLQTWREQLKLFFAFSKEQKLNYLLELSEKRVEEIKSSPSTVITRRYEDHFSELEKLANQAETKEQVAEKIKDVSLRQQGVLATVYIQVPEQAKEAIINAQANSSKHVTRTIEAVEGTQKAQEYVARIAQIQQAQKLGQIEQIEKASMEENPNANPGEFTPQELKGTNQLKEGQPLNPLNPAQNTEGSGGGNRLEQAEPVQMNQPAGQN